MTLRHIRNCITLVLLYFECVRGMPRPQESSRTARSSPRRIKLSDAAIYLGKYGYMPQSKSLGSIADFAPNTLSDPIRRFQHLAGLEETGELDGETMRYMTMPRCGVEDTVGSFSMSSKGYDTRGRYEDKRRKGRRGRRRNGRGGKGKSRSKRYDIQGNSWGKRDLTYAILSYTHDMSERDVKKAMSRGLKYWSDVSSLNFKYTEDKENADIKISFGKAAHGDAYPFDGEGGTLAHAFFPESGEAHFDDAETFSPRGEGKNLLIVAAHEFGHSLGLGHSTVPDSLMAPFYQGYVEDFKLHRDDIAAIQMLYGKNVDRGYEKPTEPRTTNKPKTKRPTVKPRTDEPDICSTDIDDIISCTPVKQGGAIKTYAFKGRYYYKLKKSGVADGYPKKIRKKWPQVGSNINAAAHSVRTGFTYFFKGKKVFVYNGTHYLRRRSEKATELLPDHPRAALAYGYDGLIYIFKKKNVYAFDDYRMTLSPEKHISGWKGVPEGIDAAFTWALNGKTYLIKGNQYYRFNDEKRVVSQGFPKSFNNDWLSCAGE